MDLCEFAIAVFVTVEQLLWVRWFIGRDQRNSRGKMRDFTVEFLKCAKFHGNSWKEFEKFTEISQTPQPLFRGAMSVQTKKSVE